QVLAALRREVCRLAVADSGRALRLQQGGAGRDGRREIVGGPAGTTAAVELENAREVESAGQIEGIGLPGLCPRRQALEPRRHLARPPQPEPEVEPVACPVEPRQESTARRRLFIKTGVDALLEMPPGEAAGEGGSRGRAGRAGGEVVAQAAP